MSSPFKDNRIQLILPAHLMRKATDRCLHLVGMEQPVLCGKNATGQHCGVCGTPTCNEHLSRKTIKLYGNVFSYLCVMCAELPEDRARDLWYLRLQLENLYEKTDLWPV
jgi:hypothetical protein